MLGEQVLMKSFVAWFQF